MSGPLRIVLTGFMGSGKTTVGRQLAAHLGWDFLDLDAVIEQEERRAVADIFAQSGEPYFRTLEHSTLLGLLGREHLVLALGGGAPTNPAVRGLLHASAETAVVHLQAPFAVLYDRCQAQALDPTAAIRPLLLDRASAEGRFHLRQPAYAAIAHHAAAADLPTPQAVAVSIAAMLFPRSKQ